MLTSNRTIQDRPFHQMVWLRPVQTRYNRFACGSRRGRHRLFWAGTSSARRERRRMLLCRNAFPDFLKWMPGSKERLLYDRYKGVRWQADCRGGCHCCLDFNAIHRRCHGWRCSCIPGKKILIDHHLHPEDFCKIIISIGDIFHFGTGFRLICRMGYFSEAFQGRSRVYLYGYDDGYRRVHL